MERKISNDELTEFIIQEHSDDYKFVELQRKIVQLILGSPKYKKDWTERYKEFLRESKKQGDKFKIIIKWGEALLGMYYINSSIEDISTSNLEDVLNQTSTYTFETLAEANAFSRGVIEAEGWNEWEEIEQEDLNLIKKEIEKRKQK